VNANEFLARLEGVKKSGSGWMARCPAHDDRNGSLSVTDEPGGRTLVYCHAGCSFEAVVTAAGLRPADLFSEPARPQRNGSPTRREPVAVYPYHDESGAVLFEVCRYEPKDFRQRRPDKSAPGGYTWKTSGVRQVPYRLPELLAGVKTGETIYIAEGEKDVAALVKAGFVATCNAGGAGKWRPELAGHIKGATAAVVIADKDAPGRKHADAVAATLAPVVPSVQVLELPDVDGKPVKDAADFFSVGGTADQLRELAQSAPGWTPATLHAEVFGDRDTQPARIRGEIVRIMTSDASPAAKRGAITRVVVSALCEAGRLYYHAERRDFDSALYFNRTTKRLERIQSDAFQSWLSDWLAVNRADGLFRYVQSEVETTALAGHQSAPIRPENFWAARPGAVYISNGDGSVVRINSQGCSVAENGTDGVLFAAGRTLAAWRLTEPQDALLSCRLFKDARCTAVHGPNLLRLWIYSLPTNPRSKPPLCLAGDVGSGKTRLAKGIAEFYGLPFVAAKVEESAEGDFWPTLDGGGLFTLDNADTRCRWLADAIANAATDGCAQRRKLYTNAETVTLRARAWIAVTTANPTFANDTGLADRLLVVRMARRDGETSDAELSDEIAAHRDVGLSHVARTLAAAIADTAPTPAGLNLRHPDFAAFAVRIGRALNGEAESVAALRAAEADKASFCLENDPIGSALVAFVNSTGSFDGTAAELLPPLAAIDPELGERWTPKRLGKRLAALWPHIAHQFATARKEPDRRGVQVFTFKAKVPALLGLER
jgi:hypothetical protein